MSSEVRLDALAETLASYTFGYVLTTRDDGLVHTSAVHASVREGRLHVPDVGARTRAHIAARPSITVLWPPVADGGYSLIVDGVATVEAGGEGADVSIAPTRAVLHRPAPPPRVTPPDGACGADCVEVPLRA